MKPDTRGNAGPVDVNAVGYSGNQAVESPDTRTVELANDEAPGAARPDAVAVGERIGRYVVRERIGAGGMGIVYAAYDAELDRVVALKLLWPGRDSETIRARLIREARALALVSHPNVVEVYDVGVTDARVFMSMELIDGIPLSEWLSKRRPWREVLPVLLQAGHGLAAAHAAELLHRDFKPDNVLVGLAPASGDGPRRVDRVRVTDFGLAKAMRDDGSSSSSAIMVRGTQSLAVTRAGTHPGTPRYMAPEQHQAKEIDARADQFAYCVALYEAICGESPFRGKTIDELRRQKEGGLAQPAFPSDVPRRISRAVVRGLSPDPRARWPTVGALLSELERPTPSPRRIALWMGLGVGAIAATVAALLPAKPEVCDAHPLAGTWNDDARERIAASFRSTGLPYAQPTWDRLSERLSVYVDGWQSLHHETCEKLRDAEPDAQRAADARMACLDVARVELEALMKVLADADATTARQAPRLVDGLTPILTCEAAGETHDGPPLPSDPEARQEVARIRELISQAQSLELAGHPDAARPPLDEAVRRAEELGFAPIVAEALTTLGSLDETTGNYGQAAARLQRATLLADEHRYDMMTAKAAIRLTFVLSTRLARHEDALRWQRFARAALDRTGNDPVLEAKLATYLLAVAGEDSEPDDAAATLRRHLERLQREDREPGLRAAAHTALGNAAFRAQRLDEAQREFERALELGLTVWGSEHPRVALYYNNLGSVLATRGEATEAKALFERALALWQGSLGDDHPEVARAHHNLGVLLTDANRQREAMEHFVQALELRSARQGTEHPEVAETLHAIAGIHRDLGEYDDAERLYLDALRVFEQTPGSMPSQLAAPLVGLGMLALERDDFEGAASTFVRVLDVQGADPQQYGEAHFGLAVSAVAVEGPNDEARQHVETALRLWDDAGPRHAARATEVRQWVRENLR